MRRIVTIEFRTAYRVEVNIPEDIQSQGEDAINEYAKLVAREADQYEVQDDIWDHMEEVYGIIEDEELNEVASWRD